MFLVDIIFIFNSAFNDDDFKLIDDRCKIAKNYLNSWFTVDLLAIIPFDIIISSTKSGNVNDVVRIARIGRMYKLIKLTRLLRILKIVKQRNKLLKHMQDNMKISIGYERLSFFMFFFVVLCHIVTCLWVFIATLADDEPNWLVDYEH